MASARIKRSIADDNRIRRIECQLDQLGSWSCAEMRHDAALEVLRVIGKLGPDQVHHAPKLARRALKVIE